MRRLWHTRGSCAVNILFTNIIIRVNKSRRIRWTGNVASMEDRRVAYRVLVRHRKANRLI